MAKPLPPPLSRPALGARARITGRQILPKSDQLQVLMIVFLFQGYQLCVLDYDFMILDNSFLIHRPGIKTKIDNLNQTQRDKVAAQNTLITKTIMPELQKLYGTRTGCEK